MECFQTHAFKEDINFREGTKFLTAILEKAFPLIHGEKLTSENCLSVFF
jgi:hypothetical protein